MGRRQAWFGDGGSGGCRWSSDPRTEDLQVRMVVRPRPEEAPAFPSAPGSTTQPASLASADRRAMSHTARSIRHRGCAARAVEQMDSRSRGPPDEGHTPNAQAVSGSVRTKLWGGHMSVDKSAAGLGDIESRAFAERGPAGRRAGVSGVCPRCGSLIPVRATGRPARWCSQRCRRAAYEERRAAAAGAIAVEVVETVTTTEHGLGECVKRVQASPVAARKVLTHLTKLLAEDGLRDPKWASTVDSAVLLARAVGASRRTAARFLTRGYVKSSW
jgi:hypothetical protein